MILYRAVEHHSIVKIEKKTKQKQNRDFGNEDRAMTTMIKDDDTNSKRKNARARARASRVTRGVVTAERERCA